MFYQQSPHEIFAPGLQARDIYPKLKKQFYKKPSNLKWEKSLTKKLDHG